MALPVVGYFAFETLLLALLWGTWVLLNFWLWKKQKALGNQLMLVGSAILCAVHVLALLSVAFGGYLWLSIIGTGILTVGFYFTVQPLVAANIDALKAKAKHAGETPKS